MVNCVFFVGITCVWGLGGRLNGFLRNITICLHCYPLKHTQTHANTNASSCLMRMRCDRDLIDDEWEIRLNCVCVRVREMVCMFCFVSQRICRCVFVRGRAVWQVRDRTPTLGHAMRVDLCCGRTVASGNRRAHANASTLMIHNWIVGSLLYTHLRRRFTSVSDANHRVRACVFL